jgi:hypothetical protein
MAASFVPLVANARNDDIRSVENFTSLLGCLLDTRQREYLLFPVASD